MHARSGLPIQQEFHGVAREVNGQIVAAFGYDSFQPAGCALHLCIDSPTGLNRALLGAAFSVPFKQWGYKYLAAIIQTSNAKSLTIAARLGFNRVGEIPGELWFGVMYRDDCRWLKPAERVR